MTACAALEDHLIDYAELPADERSIVDEHLHGCRPCREYLTLLHEIDASLAAEVRGVHLDPQRATVVRQTAAEPITRVSRLPEWLDFVAAGAVLAFAGGLAWQAGLFVAVVNAISGTP